jgi:iron complex transport system substrate-binding protein
LTNRRWILIAVVVGAFAGSYALKRSASVRTSEASGPPVARRIVSLAPSTTELLFALGLGDRVVGVTRYCEYPPEAKSRPRIGGYYDPNYEVLVQARPDLILTLPEHEGIRAELRKLGLPFRTVNHETVRGILESVTDVGAACGVPEKAAAFRSDLEARMRRVRERTAGRARPRVLISVGRMSGDSSLTRITACGRGGFYDDLIVMAGGVNAFEGEIAFPALSAEGLIAARPDVIVDLFPDLKERGLDPETVRREWTALPGVKARVHVVGDSYAVVPGPRVVLLLEELAAAIHPEAGR